MGEHSSRSLIRQRSKAQQRFTKPPQGRQPSGREVPPYEVKRGRDCCRLDATSHVACVHGVHFTRGNLGETFVLKKWAFPAGISQPQQSQLWACTGPCQFISSC